MTGSGDFTFTTNGTATACSVSNLAAGGVPVGNLAGLYRAARLDPGTTATGLASVVGDRWVELGSAACDFNTSVAMPAVSDATNRFEVQAGLTSGFQAMSAVSTFIGFYYRDDVNGGKWQAKVRSASTPTETNVDTGITVALNTLYELRIIVNAARTEAKFYINGALVATISTNFPAAAANLSYGAAVQKTVGTTSRPIYVGYTEFIPDSSFWRPYA
jgi:hypothetical protein